MIGGRWGWTGSAAMMGAVVLLLAMARPAAAVPIADVDALTVDGIRFSGFSVESFSLPSRVAVVLTPGDIDVTAVTGPDGSGLRFSAPYDTGPRRRLDVKIRFEATSLDPSSRFDAVTLAWDGVAVAETRAGGFIATTVVDPAAGSGVGDAFVEVSGTGPIARTASGRFDPLPSVGIENALVFDGGLGPCPVCSEGIVSVSFFSVTLARRTVAASEPSALLLVAIGFVGLGLVRRHPGPGRRSPVASRAP
jgi:hypothetical protein